jgi:hypothetical protein
MKLLCQPFIHTSLVCKHVEYSVGTCVHFVKYKKVGTSLHAHMLKN